jgi:hypothetical protein
MVQLEEFPVSGLVSEFFPDLLPWLAPGNNLGDEARLFYAQTALKALQINMLGCLHTQATKI